MSSASFPNSPPAPGSSSEPSSVAAAGASFFEEVDVAAIVRVMRDDGSLDPAADSPVDASDVTVLYRAMLRARLLDQRFAMLEEQGRIGFHQSALGEEAAVLGSVYATRPEDWIFPGDRELAAALWRGMPLQRYVDHMFGNANDPARGRQRPGHFTCREAHVAQLGSPGGAQITQAVGMAWAAKMKKDRAVMLAYFGESLTSSGEFHNAMNFAGVFKAPVVFFCRNGSSRGESSVRQTASATYAEKGVAYGVPSVRCDGGDLFAVIKVTRDAVERAAQGGGPTFIEALTSPIGERGAGADPSDGDHGASNRSDPLTRLRRVLQRGGSWSESTDREIESTLMAELRAAIKAAEETPRPPLESMFVDVYADVTWHLQEQERELLTGPRAKEH